MQTTYKFRLYPTKEQEQKLLWTLNKCRYVYNFLLSELENQKIIDKAQLQEMITDLKRIEPELQKVHSKALQYENYRLFSNLRALSQLKKNGKKVGRLRFKGKQWFKTFTYNQSGFAIMQNQTRYDKLWLSKIGEIPFIMHRDVEGKIKHITIKHYPSGKWYASIIAETNNEIPKTENKGKVGIDLGTINYAYDSNGNHFDNPKHLDKSLKKLRKEQRRLSIKKKGSSNRQKQKIRVARIHEKIANQRNDFLHKLSHYYASNYGYMAVENLNIKGMVRNRYLAKSIMDASWSRFIQMLCYKAERAGCTVVKVEPRGTTQKCSNCGQEVHKELWNRIHKCSCGLEIDRDYNSAMNILKRALESLPLERRESTPVEIEPLLSVEQVWSEKQEAPCDSWE
ncbi:MAG: IS200/IS605 family element transposase accessory protein TnpB [Candidatus Aenigmarchaeota archaeon]|nr:IS200/IS605 family element transposase accessory protein TnpB [Candidatus Aenigmarchaeota archaeon]